jgi:hypothetical protein
METILILISLYLLGFFLLWNYIRIAYNEKGIWYGIKPSIVDFLFVISPFNLICFIVLRIIGSPYYKPYINNNNINWLENLIQKFFRINK